VDEDEAVEIVGNAEFVAAGRAAQCRSIVKLKLAPEGSAHLPLRTGLKIYTEGIDTDEAARIGTIVSTPAAADLAIIRARTPFEPLGEGFEAMFHQGSLEFHEEEKQRILQICETVPTIFDIHLERAAIFPEIAEAAATVTANFGASSAALVDVLLQPELSTGRLPMELPRSTAAILASKSDVPYDTENPVFTFGAGL
jgi:beta-glucosidase